MKMHILLQITSGENGHLAQTCWPNDKCGNVKKSVANSKNEAISRVRKLVSNFIEEYGRQYIEPTENNNCINCPQGKTELPIDNWHCKDTKTSCPLQGQLSMSDPDVFFERCLLAEEKKNGIWNAIVKGEYKGFHHIPGRYLCGLCNKSRRYYNYHFPWELTHLSAHCDLSSIWNNPKRAKELILSGFPREAITTYLCCECFFKASKYIPEININEYEVMIYEYIRNK